MPPAVALVLAFFFRNFLDFLELSETAGTARVEAAAGLAEHMDDVDIAQPVGRGLVGKGFFKAEAAAFAGQPVAIDVAVAHLEIDGLVVDHIGRSDAGAHDTAFRLANFANFIFVIVRSSVGGKGGAAGGEDRGEDERGLKAHSRLLRMVSILGFSLH
ncbi:hypothetical protein SPHINGOR109_51000 [Sphingorhabdus sp. 109]|nr:hypothetical protein SPHINGOR109_51000 [Sphingorhabdus sp. 109]